MRILIDDFKSTLPNGSTPDLIIRNYDAARLFLTAFSGSMGNHEIYLDHDLGGDKDGYDWMCDLERLVHIYGKVDYILPKKIVCVSDNGAGRRRIELVIKLLYNELDRS